MIIRCKVGGLLLVVGFFCGVSGGALRAEPLPAAAVPWLQQTQKLDCEQSTAERAPRVNAVFGARAKAQGMPSTLSGPPEPVLIANAQLHLLWAQLALKDGRFCRGLYQGMNDAKHAVYPFIKDKTASALYVALHEALRRVKALGDHALRLPENKDRELLNAPPAKAIALAKDHAAALLRAVQAARCQPKGPEARVMVALLEDVAEDLASAEQLREAEPINTARCRARSLIPGSPDAPISDSEVLAYAQQSLEAHQKVPASEAHGASTAAILDLRQTLAGLKLNTTLEGARIVAALSAELQRRELAQVRAVMAQAQEARPSANKGGPLAVQAAMLQKMGGAFAAQGQVLANLPSDAARQSEGTRKLLAAQASCYTRHTQHQKALKIWQDMLAKLRASEQPGGFELLDAEIHTAALSHQAGGDARDAREQLVQAIRKFEAAHAPPHVALIASHLRAAYGSLAKLCTAARDPACARAASDKAEALAKHEIKVDMNAYLAQVPEPFRSLARNGMEFGKRMELVESSDHPSSLAALRAAKTIDAISLMHLAQLEFEAGDNDAAVSALEDGSAGLEALSVGLIGLGAGHAGAASSPTEGVGPAASTLDNLAYAGSLAAALAVEGMAPERTAPLALWLAEQRKGRLFDARSLKRPQAPAEAVRQWELVRAARAQHARRFLADFAAGTRTECDDMDPQSQQLMELEAKFLDRSGSPMAALRAVSFINGAPRSTFPRGQALQFTREVGKSLREGTRFISIVRTRKLDKAPAFLADRWQRPRYVALLVEPAGVRAFALGDAAELDLEITRVVEEIARTGPAGDAALSAVRGSLARLAKRSYAPWSDPVSTAKALVLSFDGSSAALPFAALHDGKSWLAERFVISRVHSARDLLRKGRSNRDPSESLALVDPVPPRAPPGGLQELTPEHFPALSGARREAAVLKVAFPDTRVLQGAQASEAALFAADSPHILHIAGHALFLGAAAETAGDTRGLHRVVSEHAVPAASAPPEGERGFMRSALVLAETLGIGVEQGTSDGYASGYEVLSLDLHGTTLVTLSACETGRGSVFGLHGVTGLERAFITAGAESVVSSAWQVNDEAAADWMSAFYAALARTGERAEAVQQASASVRKRFPHPYYWAPFSLLEGVYGRGSP